MRRIVGSALLVGLVALSLIAPAAPASRGDFAGWIQPKATLVDGGTGAIAEFAIRCPAGAQILEAFVYVTQDGNTSQFGFLRPLCDGRRYTYTRRVTMLDMPLSEGRARVSLFVLLTTGESISPTRVVQLRA